MERREKGKKEGDEFIISTSRFNVLAFTEEEGEGEESPEIEEGEVVMEGETTEVSLKGTKRGAKQVGVTTSKQGRRKVVNTRDLKILKAHTTHKKASVRKL